MKLPTVIKGQVGQYIVLGVVGIGAFWIIVKYVLPKLAKDTTKGLGQSVGNALQGVNEGLGSNDLTNGGTSDFGGDPIDYSGHGPISTLGAAANAASGGIFASIGEYLGRFVPGSGYSYDPNASGTNRAQVVTPNYATDIDQVAPVGGNW